MASGGPGGSASVLEKLPDMSKEVELDVTDNEQGRDTRSTKIGDSKKTAEEGVDKGRKSNQDSTIRETPMDLDQTTRHQITQKENDENDSGETDQDVGSKSNGDGGDEKKNSGDSQHDAETKRYKELKEHRQEGSEDNITSKQSRFVGSNKKQNDNEDKVLGQSGSVNDPNSDGKEQDENQPQTIDADQEGTNNTGDIPDENGVQYKDMQTEHHHSQQRKQNYYLVQKYHKENKGEIVIKRNPIDQYYWKAYYFILTNKHCLAEIKQIFKEHNTDVYIEQESRNLCLHYKGMFPSEDVTITWRKDMTAILTRYVMKRYAGYSLQCEANVHEVYCYLEKSEDLSKDVLINLINNSSIELSGLLAKTTKCLCEVEKKFGILRIYDTLQQGFVKVCQFTTSKEECDLINCFGVVEAFQSKFKKTNLFLDEDDFIVYCVGDAVDFDNAIKFFVKQTWMDDIPKTKCNVSDLRIFTLIRKEETEMYLIREKLQLQKGNYIWRFETNSNEIVVYAESKEISSTVAHIIEKSFETRMIDTKHKVLIVTQDWLKKRDHMLQSYKGKLMIDINEEENKILFLGTDDAMSSIADFVTETCELLNQQAKSPIVKTINIENRKFQHLQKYNSGELEEIADDNNVEIIPLQTQFKSGYHLKGEEEKGVKYVSEHIKTLESNVDTQCHVVQSAAVAHDLTVENGKRHKIEAEYKCCIKFETQIDDSPSLSDFKSESWQMEQDCKLTLILGSAIDVPSDVMVECGTLHTGPGFIHKVNLQNLPGQRKMRAEMSIPSWCEKTESKEKELMRNALEHSFLAVQAANLSSIAIDIQNMANWPWQKLIKMVIYSLKEFLKKHTGIKQVLLCDKGENSFQNAMNVIEDAFQVNRNTEVISITVEKGELAKQKVDVIVNTTSVDLRLENGAVSKSISQAAGPGMQKEIDRWVSDQAGGRIKYGEIAVTGGYNLPCSKVYHGALQWWPQRSSFNYEEESKQISVMHNFVTKCLKDADLGQRKTIAFPALGTGKLKYPPKIVAREMIEAIRNFEKSQTATSLTDVKIIIYHTDDKIYQIFQEELELSNMKGSQKESSSQNLGFKDISLSVGVARASTLKGHDGVILLWSHNQLFSSQTCNKDIFDALEPNLYGNWLSKKQQLVKEKMLVYDLPKQTPHVIINVYVTDNSVEESILKAVKCANEKHCSIVLLTLSTTDTVLCSNLKNYSKCLCSAITRLNAARPVLKRIKLCVEQENVFQKLKPHLEMEHKSNGAPTAPERPKRKRQLERTQKTELRVIITAEKNSIPKVISAIDSLDRDIQQDDLSLMPTTESIKKGDLMNKSPDGLDVNTSLIKTVTNLSPDSHKEMESQERKQSSHHSEKRICLERTKDIDCLLVARFTAVETGAEILKQHISLRIQGPAYVLFPYQGNKMEALLVYKSLEDAEKAYSLGSKFHGFRIEKLPPQVLFNISAELDSNVVKKLEEKSHYGTIWNKMVMASGVSYKKLGNGGLQLSSILPQIELALDFLESYLADDTSTNAQNEMSQSRLEQTSNCIDKVLCSQKDYEVFLFFFAENIPKLLISKNSSLRYDDGGIEIVADNKESVRGIKHKVQENINKINTYAHEDIPVEDCDDNMCIVKSKEMQDEFPDVFYAVYGNDPHLITLVCPDEKKIHNAKYKLLHLLGKTTGRGHRHLVIKENEVPSEKYAGKSSDVPLGTDPRPKPVPVSQIGGVKTFKTDEDITVYIYCKDILSLPVECIVNATNAHLEHKRGIAKVICEAAGDRMIQESNLYIKKYKKLSVGKCCSTTAGDLHYKCIIHTVGPNVKDYDALQGGVETCGQKLKTAIENCLFEAADSRKMVSIGIPPVSSGMFGVPKEICSMNYALAVQQASTKFLQSSTLKEIHFVDTSYEMVQCMQAAFEEIFEKQRPQRHLIKKEDAGPSPANISEDHHKHAQAMSTSASRRFCDPSSNFIPKIETRMHQKIEVTEYLLAKSTKVCIYEEDMLNSYAEAIACGDDEKFQHKGHIAKEVTNKLLKNQKKELKVVHSSKDRFSIGEVLLVSKERARDSNISHVFFVITPMWTSGTNEEDFLANIKFCFTNVLRKATDLGVRSVALPLLGTGNAGSPIDEVATILHEVILQYVSNSTLTDPLREIHIVNKTSAYIVKKIFLASGTPRDKDLLRMDGNLRQKSSNVNHHLEGTMTCRLSKDLHCCGHKKFGTFIVIFDIKDGQQRKGHPYPGKPFTGFTRRTYLPGSPMGKELLKFLYVAFQRGLLFEISLRKTNDYAVICKNIVHKSSTVEGEYPDPGYCERTIEELKRLGITDNAIEKVELSDFMK